MSLHRFVLVGRFFLILLFSSSSTYANQLYSESSLGYSIESKSGSNGDRISGSFLKFGAHIKTNELLSFGLNTLLDGGSSEDLENYRLTILPTVTFKVNTLVDQLAFSFGRFSETGTITQKASDPLKYTLEGTSLVLFLTKQLVQTSKLSVSINTILGKNMVSNRNVSSSHQTSKNYLDSSKDIAPYLKDSMFRGISIGTTFWL